MCGERMRLVQRESVDHIPGNPKPAVRTTSEWTCPECEHFEDAEGNDD
jgi:hypothetical protein